MTTKIKDGGPAYPARVSVNRNTGRLQPHQFGNDDFCTEGMSLRDYFAAKAMQANATNSVGDGYTFEQRAEWAYAQADAMLKAREEA